MVKFNHITQH